MVAKTGSGTRDRKPHLGLGGRRPARVRAQGREPVAELEAQVRAELRRMGINPVKIAKKEPAVQPQEAHRSEGHRLLRARYLLAKVVGRRIGCQRSSSGSVQPLLFP